MLIIFVVSETIVNFTKSSRAVAEERMPTKPQRQSIWKKIIVNFVVGFCRFIVLNEFFSQLRDWI